MGRKKKVKTELEIEEYQLRRREQNKINQRRFRLKKKILTHIIDTENKSDSNKQYRKEFSQFLKKLDFDRFVTITTKNIFGVKKLTFMVNHFINSLRGLIKIDRVFFVIEKGPSNHPHVHLLLKSNEDCKNVRKSIISSWDEGFVLIKKIFSIKENYTLENYLLKEIHNKSIQEINWDIN